MFVRVLFGESEMEDTEKLIVMTFGGLMVLLASGGSDGLLVIWNADYGQDSRDLVPKLSLKAHDGGVVAVELSRVVGAPPQLITIGADKTLAIWDTMSFKELRRIKPVSKLACHSVASWCHPRAPNLDILTCVKDSHIWAIEHPTYSALTRPLCELSSLVPPQLLASHKKLRVYSMVAHTLQPHLVATGTNIGVLVCEFDAKALPPIAPLATLPGSREHAAVYVVERELKLLQFQLSNTANPALGSNGSLNDAGRVKGDTPEQLHVKQIKSALVLLFHMILTRFFPYLAIVWPDIPYFSVYKVSDWSIVDSGGARLLAWDTCRDRFALLESALPPRMPIVPKGSSSRKAKEAAAAAAQAAALAASAASSASVQVRILLDDGTSNILMRSVGSRSEPVIGLHGGALLGVAYRTSRRISPVAAAAISTTMPLSGFGSSSLSSFSTIDDGYSSQKSSAEAAPQNFQLYSWETFQPVGGLLPQPEWTAWDQTVEYCAFAYQQYIVISSLRPQFRYLGDVAIPFATGAVWHRRQLFVTTPTTVECVFVDAGIAPIDIETKKRKEEMRLKELQARAVAEHGELALITVDTQQSSSQERMTLRPPMLQVVRLASFQHAPSIPPFLTLPKQSKVDDDPSLPKEMEERKINEVAVGGGGVAVAVTRFPAEQKRPVGPLVVAGHPGIRCRCLAAYGDAVSAVKWASRLGREHHDDLAQFMLGMGYATEALHLPGISKRLEFDLAMQSNDLKRALQCLLTMSNSRDIGQEALGFDLNDIMNLSSKKENVVDAVQGVAKFAKEFLDLIDAADATAQADIAREALKRLAAAGSVKGALQGHELRGLALRLANHGELTRLSNLVTSLVSVGSGREAAFAAALLGDNVLMEKAWQETGMLAEAVLHAHAHGSTYTKELGSGMEQDTTKELEHTPSTKMDAATAFLASLKNPRSQACKIQQKASNRNSATRDGIFIWAQSRLQANQNQLLQPVHLHLHLLPQIQNQAPSESERDASVNPVTESSDPTLLQSDDKTVENQEQTSSVPSVSEPTGMELSVIPASTNSTIATDAELSFPFYGGKIRAINKAKPLLCLISQLSLFSERREKKTTTMPTFATVPLESLLELRARDSLNKKLFNGGQEDPDPERQNGRPRHRHLYISPALCVTPEQAPIPDYTSPDPLSPSPYVINHKCRHGGNEPTRAGVGEVSDFPSANECGGFSLKEEIGDNFVNRNMYANDDVDEDDDEGFLDTMSGSMSVGSEVGENDLLAGKQIESQSSVSAQGEFFDANDVVKIIESELHATRLSILEEIERRKCVEETLIVMRCQWERICSLMSEAGLTFPAPPAPSDNMQIENNSIDQFFQEVVVTRFVAEAIGRGMARAEAEEAAAKIIELKDQEILRLHDRLHYYEIVNHELSQRKLVEKELHLLHTHIPHLSSLKSSDADSTDASRVRHPDTT
ncbi:hypothetical protein DH2020_047127 [Rehmannia glutinosa]|uniref:Uncharacterized protein n=1 Tax=Rehmannia glutinosa TaxID=99300 RepID=A0ABR0U9H7_REHGL